MLDNPGIPNMTDAEFINFLEGQIRKIAEFTDSVFLYRTIFPEVRICISEKPAKNLINYDFRTICIGCIK